MRNTTISAETKGHSHKPKPKLQKVHSDEHYDIMEKLKPTRPNLRALSLRGENYSSTDSSDRDSDDDYTDDGKLRTDAASKVLAKKIAQKYEYYKEFHVQEMLRCMSESGHRTDQKYVLARSSDWRSMWQTSLNILGKKQYLVTKNDSSKPSGSSGMYVVITLCYAPPLCMTVSIVILTAFVVVVLLLVFLFLFFLFFLLLLTLL
jgi:hypothetical protein